MILGYGFAGQGFALSSPDSMAGAGSCQIATSGATVTTGGAVNDPLGLAIAANGGDGNLVETTPRGQQVAVKMLDTSPAPPGPNGNGTLFGLAVAPDGSGVYFVDDGQHP